MTDERLAEIEQGLKRWCEWVGEPPDFHWDAEELLAEVKRLRAELKDHHCASCDGSAKECGGPC